MTAYNEAVSLLESNKIEAAKNKFEELIKSDPKNIKIDAIYRLGICEFRLKNFEKSESYFNFVTGRDNSNYEAWYYKGLSLERQGKLEDSDYCYKFSLAIKPDFEQALNKTKDKKNINIDNDLTPDMRAGFLSQIKSKPAYLVERIFNFVIGFSVGCVATAYILSMITRESPLTELGVISGCVVGLIVGYIAYSNVSRTA